MIKKILKNSLFFAIVATSALLFASLTDLLEVSPNPSIRTGSIPGVDKQPCYKITDADADLQPVPGFENPEGRCALNSVFHVLMPAISPFQEELMDLFPAKDDSVISSYLADLKNYQATDKLAYRLKSFHTWAAQALQRKNGFDNIGLLREFALAWNKQAKDLDCQVLYLDVDTEQIKREAHTTIITGNANLQEDFDTHMIRRDLCFQDPPRILILTSSFQYYISLKASNDLNIPGIAHKDIIEQRAAITPYEAPEILDITQHVEREGADANPVQYQLVGIEQLAFYHTDGNYEGHSRSFALHDDNEWIHMDNNIARKIIATNPVEYIIKDMPGINSSFIYLRIDEQIDQNATNI